MRDYTPDPRLYEMMTILSPDVPEDDLPAQVETIAGYITTAGGAVNETLRESPWGRRRLAYSIRHAGRDIRDGYYTVFHFTLDPGGVRDLERDLKLNDQVMRFLITHYTPKPVVPGAVTEGGEEASAGGDAPAAADAVTADTTPTEAAADAAGTTDARNEATEARTADAAAAESMEAEAASSESAPSTESLTDIAVPTETSDTEAAVAASEVAENAVAVEAPAEEPAAAEAASEEPASAEPAVDEPASEETTAEPTVPAKDDEEA